MAPQLLDKQIRAYMAALSIPEPWRVRKMCTHQTLHNGVSCWIHIGAVEIPQVDASNLSILARNPFTQCSIQDLTEPYFHSLSMYAMTLYTILTEPNQITDQRPAEIMLAPSQAMTISRRNQPSAVWAPFHLPALGAWSAHTAVCTTTTETTTVQADTTA